MAGIGLLPAPRGGLPVPEADDFAPLRLPDGGGYGWHGVADALTRLKAPKLKKKVRFDPEAGMFTAHGTDREALVQLAKLMKEAMTDPAVLSEALANVKPGLMG
jgi:hypothetical protein